MSLIVYGKNYGIHLISIVPKFDRSPILKRILEDGCWRIMPSRYADDINDYHGSVILHKMIQLIFFYFFVTVYEI